MSVLEVYPECIWGQASEKVLKVTLPPMAPVTPQTPSTKVMMGGGGSPHP